MVSPCMSMIFVLLFVMNQSVAQGQVIDCSTNDVCYAYDGAICHGNPGICTCVASLYSSFSLISNCDTVCSLYVPCQNGGQCDRNSGTCTCSSGYRGSLCEREDPTTSCGSNQVVCSPYASCYNRNNDQICVCDIGYTGDGISCSGVDCGPTPVFDNGRASLIDSTDTTYGATATVSCNQGYKASVSVLTCLQTGLWDYVPACVIIDCGPTINAVRYGTATPHQNTTFGSTAAVVCYDGYENPSPGIIACEHDGTWSSSSCVIKDCGPDINTTTNGIAVQPLRTTFGSTTPVLCDEGYENPSEERITCQADGKWSVLSCLIKDCGSNITTVEFGTALINSATTFGSTASVTCNEGYDNPIPTTLTCQASGAWSISSCSIRDCGSNIDSVVSGTTLISSTTFGSTASVTCNEGYEAASPTAITCQANGTWSNSTCSIKDCGPNITTVEFGTALINSPTTFGSTASVTCNEGYESPFPTTLTCQASGAWSTSYCSIRDCGLTIDSVVSGTALIHSTAFGSTASVTCNKGYEAASPTAITCQANGTWSNSTCSIKDCGSLSNPANGRVSISPDTNYQGTATFTCNTGYLVAGTETTSTQRTCASNGSWSGDIVLCNKTDCGSLSNPANGRVSISPDTKYQGTATFSCNTGYLVAGTDTSSIQRTCASNGSWTGDLVMCNKTDCGDLQHPQNGAVSFSPDTRFNATAKYMCDDGHVITGTTNITSVSRLCLANGTWSRNATTCAKRDGLKHTSGACYKESGIPTKTDRSYTTKTTPENIDESFMNSPLVNIYISSTIIAFSPGSVIIQAKLEFSTQQMTVDNEVIELDARLVEDTLKVGINDTNTELDEITVTESPNCGPLTQPDNGAILFDPDTYYGAKALYTCNQGYLISETAETSATRACTLAGNWSGTEITCYRACDAPAGIEHGDVSYTNRISGSQVIYSCDVGYNLVGESLRTCQNDGMWTELPPVCRIISCVMPENITNGRVQASDGTRYGDTATYSCDDGFTLFGEPTRQCNDTGTWLGSPPSCQSSDVQMATCARIQSDAYNYSWAEQIVGNTSSHPCPDNSSGAVTKVCKDDGGWSETKFECKRKIIVSIQRKALSLNENSTSDEIAVNLEALNNITKISTVNDTKDVDLTQAELEALAGTLDYLANVIRPDTLTEAITDVFLNVANNLIDEENTMAWENSDSGAAQVLSAVDDFTDILTEQLVSSANTKIVISKENIVVEVRKVSSSTAFVFPNTSVKEDVLDDWVKQTLSSVVLNPENLLGNTSYITRASIYRDISRILPTTRTPQRLGDNDDVKEINGPVVALSISPPVVRKLDPPVTLTFEHSKKNLKEATCNFWVFADYNPGYVPGYWSSEGCSVASTNDTITVCHCDHLTNFAVLMSPFQAVDAHSIPLRIVSIVGISVSILGIAITMFLHLCLWRYLRSNSVIIHMNLYIALLISYVTFIGGVDRIESKESCAFVAALLHYLYLVVFFTMLAEGIEIGSSVLFLFSKKSRVKPLLFMAWVLPGIIVAISLGVTKAEGYGNNDFCWLSIESGLIWAFVGPALAVIIFNSVCLTLVFRKLFTTKAMAQKKKGDKIKTSVRSLCVLMPLMGLTWLIGIFNINEGFYWIQYMFAICNGLQGFFIFLIHCVFNRHMKRALETRKRRKTSTSMTSPSIKKVGMSSKMTGRGSRKNKEFSSAISQDEEIDSSISLRKTIEDSGRQEIALSTNRRLGARVSITTKSKR